MNTQSACRQLVDTKKLSELHELTYRHSTSTFLTSSDIRTRYDFDGPMGYYMLFSESDSIVELGSLTVDLSNVELKKWKRFEEKEILVSLKLRDSSFRLNEYLFVGNNISIVKHHLGELEKVEKNYYTFKNDCYFFEITCNGDGGIEWIRMTIASYL
jgi:hypothetical protein